MESYCERNLASAFEKWAQQDDFVSLDDLECVLAELPKNKKFRRWLPLAATMVQDAAKRGDVDPKKGIKKTAFFAMMTKYFDEAGNAEGSISPQDGPKKILAEPELDMGVDLDAAQREIDAGVRSEVEAKGGNDEVPRYTAKNFRVGIIEELHSSDDEDADDLPSIHSASSTPPRDSVAEAQPEAAQSIIEDGVATDEERDAAATQQAENDLQDEAPAAADINAEDINAAATGHAEAGFPAAAVVESDVEKSRDSWDDHGDDAAGEPGPTPEEASGGVDAPSVAPRCEKAGAEEPKQAISQQDEGDPSPIGGDEDAEDSSEDCHDADKDSHYDSDGEKRGSADGACPMEKAEDVAEASTSGGIGDDAKDSASPTSEENKLDHDDLAEQLQRVQLRHVESRAETPTEATSAPSYLAHLKEHAERVRSGQTRSKLKNSAKTTPKRKKKSLRRSASSASTASSSAPSSPVEVSKSKRAVGKSRRDNDSHVVAAQNRELRTMLAVTRLDLAKALEEMEYWKLRAEALQRALQCQK